MCRCRHQVVARIFLFLSIVNFTFAGLAQTPMVHEQIPVDFVSGTADDVTEPSERGHTQSEELPEWSGIPASKAGDLHSRVDPLGPQLIKPDDPEKDKFFNEEVIRKMKEYLVLGTVSGVFVGISNVMQKEIFGVVSPNAQTVGRSVEPLDDEYPQDQEDLVSRSLSNMGDKDLQMLSIMSRRLLNSLD